MKRFLECLLLLQAHKHSPYSSILRLSQYKACLFRTHRFPSLKKLSAAKKVQTCDLMLDFLKENVEFMMLNKAGFEKFKKQLSVLVKTLDSSTRLLFAQNIAATNTDDGNSMIELLFEVFEKDLIEMLDLSDTTRKLIEES